MLTLREAAGLGTGVSDKHHEKQSDEARKNIHHAGESRVHASLEVSRKSEDVIKDWFCY